MDSILHYVYFFDLLLFEFCLMDQTTLEYYEKKVVVEWLNIFIIADVTLQNIKKKFACWESIPSLPINT